MGSHDSALYKRNRAMLRRQSESVNAPCYYCGCPIDYHASRFAPLSFTADHVIPVAAGGSDRMENLVPCHWKCNRAKSDMLAVPMARRKRTIMQTRDWE